jgi:hypothetical protein
MRSRLSLSFTAALSAYTIEHHIPKKEKKRRKKRKKKKKRKEK